MKLKSTVCWLVVAAVLAFGVVGCKKGPQRMTSIKGLKPGEVQTPPESPPAGPEKPTQPIKVEEPTKVTPTTSAPETASGRPLGPGHEGWAPNREMFALQTVHFDFDKSIVKASEMPKVEEVAKRLKEMPGKAVLIEGHCDERGTEEYNRALGERRALAIREKLVSLGVAANDVDTISFGKDKPVDPGHNDIAWAKNRRGEFVLLSPPGGGS